ncbi:hypothetical protein IHE44_0003138 [Lamprotornis superbus]|uniref:Forty-two-three domain-containing protein 1 n=1 Tax=Lamprotornis superbus TaxID=245042 RepID=A0A835TXY3_9PASS|nr:hypothetical protein IHE44_0003138 [Lamprotornis superbus]
MWTRSSQNSKLHVYRGQFQAPKEGITVDDIIKRHRKEQTDASTAGDSRRQQVKNRSSASGYGRPRYGAWKQRNLQGPNRFRRGFGQQQFNRRQFRNTLPGRKRRAAAAFDGVSPLNRQASAQESIFQVLVKSKDRLGDLSALERNILPGTCSSVSRKRGTPPDWLLTAVSAAVSGEQDLGNKKSNVFAKSSSGQQEEQPQPSPGPKRFRADAASIRAPGRRPFLLNRGPVFQQKRVQQWFSKARFQRGMDSQGEGKPLRMRR